MKPSPALMASLLCALLSAGAASAASPQAPALTPALDPELATVNDDTIRVSDLQLELHRMQGLRQGDAQLVLPPAEDVLKRLVQNTLLTQEGYRMGHADAPTVRNQIADAIRRNAMAALLDSVALAVPDDKPDLLEARQAAVRGFVEGLKQRYDVTVNRELLASLDYGSTDSLTQQRLRESEEVLAVVPSGKLRVKGLSKNIRFTHFHGLQGRPDAAEIRDRMFDEWVAEALLTHEARARGFEQRRELREMGRRMERNLVREEALSALLSFNFKPKDKEIEAFYKTHLAQFTPEPRVKVESALLDSQETARTFHERLRQGAKFRWLADRTAEVQKGITPFPAEWIAPAALGLRPEEVAANKVLDPYEVPGGWAVAIISAVEDVAPTPLAACRDRVLAAMKAQRTREVLAESLRRLEEAARVRVTPDALAHIQRSLKEVSGGKS